MRIKTLIAVIILCILCAALYSALWFFWAQQVTQQVKTFQTDAALQGTVIDGNFTPVTGFPGAFHIGFSGRIVGGVQALNLPRVEVTGFFLPGTALTVDMPQGVSIQAPELDTFSSSLDSLRLTARIPSPLPASFTARDLYRWQETGQAVDITALHVVKGPLVVGGQGTIGLDRRLQPVANLPVKITGHMAFLAELQDRHLVKNRAAMIAGAVLGGLARTDDAGNSYLPLTLSIQKSTLYAGPLRVIDVPPVLWPE